MRDDETGLQDEVPTRTVNPDDLDTEAGVVPAEAHAATNLIGRRLGRYTVLDELGSGGMGEVLLGDDPEASPSRHH